MLLTIFCPVVRSQEHLAPIMSLHLSLFKMVGLHYMPFFACHDCKDNTSSAAGLKIYRIQLSGDELRLETHFHRELYLARSSGANRADRRRCVDGLNDAAKTGNAECGLRQTILGMVKNVEELGAKLKARAFRERDALAGAEIHLPGARSASGVAGCISECAGGRNGEGRRVDPLANRRSPRRRERNARHDVRALIGSVAVGNRRRRTINQNVDRESGASHEGRSDFPSAGNRTPEAWFAKELLSRPQGKFVNGVGIENVTCVPDAGSAFARLAGDVLRDQRIAVAAAIGAVIDLMRPHVICPEQETAGERTLYGKREGVVVAVVLVAAPTHLPKVRVGTSSSRRTDNVHFREREQMNHIGASIRGSSDEVGRQLLLNRQAPLFYVGIFAAAVIVAR